MEATVQVRQRGTLTLPAELRAKYGIQPGDTFRLVDFDGTLVLTPMALMVPELAREIERLRLESGLSIEEALGLLPRAARALPCGALCRRPTRVSCRVFVDAGVLFAGSAAPREHGASLVVLRLAEITLIEAVASQQVITEANAT